MTPKQKLFKTKLLSLFDKLIAYVEELKAADVPTSLDTVLKQQRQRIHDTNQAEILLQIGAETTLSGYIDRLDSLEDSVDEDSLSEHDTAALERKGDALDNWLVDAAKELDKLRKQVEEESVELHAAASCSPAFAAAAKALAGAGALLTLVQAFQRRSLSDRIKDRKLRKRWLKTPAGKASLKRSKRLAKRPHVIDRAKSKTSKLVHRTYRY